MKRSHVWLDSYDSWLLHENNVLSVYEENSDCHRVSRVVLQEDCFKIWNFKWYNHW